MKYTFTKTGDGVYITDVMGVMVTIRRQSGHIVRSGRGVATSSRELWSAFDQHGHRITSGHASRGAAADAVREEFKAEERRGVVASYQKPRSPFGPFGG